MKNNILILILQPLLVLLKGEANNIDGDNKYKLSFYPFTINILIGVIQGIGSIGKLVTHIKTLPNSNELELVKASKSMYSESFSRYSARHFKLIFMSLLKTLNYIPIPEIQTMGQFYLIDGSIFPVMKTMIWAKYKKGHSAIKLHLCFSLNLMLPVTFMTTDANYSEKEVLSQLIEEAITFIADRGYFKFRLFNEIVSRGAHFIIRGKTSMKYTIIGSFISEIPSQMLYFISNISDVLIVFDNDKSHSKYRLISFSIMGDIYNLVTDRFDLATYQIIILYAYRWQVELIFRFMKRTLNGLHLLSHNPNGIEIQFTIYMIAYLLLVYTKQQCNIKCKETNNSSTLTSDLEKAKSKSTRSNGYDLVTILGKRLQEYWKISIHWLITLRNLLFEEPNQQNLNLLC
jgi:hypothetical protein